MTWNRIVLLAAVALGVLVGLLGGALAAWAPLAVLVAGWLVWTAVDRQVSGVVSRPGPLGPGRRVTR